ncbi:MAG TPA: class I SAM-dependent methyltransferase [Pirellulales bacterium]|jgi:ubiquinone/menaquinone biosynthesis C-methylase UbiE|nr:class I SAM-dependent methyltransferase [Pirellulales bacterium]
MGIYRNYIFPYMLELSLGGKHPMERRRQALEESRGDVLEIGFGTGLNLACYPRSVARLTLLDSEKLLPKRVAKRIEAAGFPVEMAQLDAAQLPFESERFDTVVSTWTLCTIPDVASALAEVRRVLKPGGSLLFLEHGLSSDPRIARRQDRWNPVQRFIGLGCNLNRPIDTLIASAGLTIERLDRFLMPHTQRIAADHYLGSARRD